MNCPYCHSEIVRTSAIDGSRVTPKKGDYSVCSSCGETLVYVNDKGAVRKITVEEEVGMPDDIRDFLSEVQFRMKSKIKGGTL